MELTRHSRTRPYWCAPTILCAALLSAGATAASAGSPMAGSQFTHALVVKSDGTLWAWGDNQFGQLGYDTATDADPNNDGASAIPQQVGADSDWLSAATGENFSLALKEGGALYAWGLNNFGQAGQDPNLSGVVALPSQISGEWARVAAGTFHAVGLRRDGTLWSWGYNRHGELGLGSVDPDPHPVPTQVGTSADWVSVDTKGYHSLGLKADGSLWGWGDNTSGQSGQAVPGDGSGDFVLRPTRIGTETAWAAVAGTLFFSLGVKSDGSLWAWGNNSFGQLGTGSADPLPNDPPVVHQVPARVGSGTDWLLVSGGETRGLGVRADGTLWAWGRLGGSVSGPLQIGTDTDWAVVAGESMALDRSGNIAAWTGDAGVPPQDVTGFNVGADTTPPSVSAAPPAGTYQGSISVTLHSSDDSTMRPTIRYTTDGTDPGPASTAFSAPLVLTQTTTVKFFAEDAWGNRSATATTDFTVSTPSGGGGGGGGCFLNATQR